MTAEFCGSTSAAGLSGRSMRNANPGPKIPRMPKQKPSAAPRSHPHWIVQNQPGCSRRWSFRSPNSATPGVKPQTGPSYAQDRRCEQRPGNALGCKHQDRDAERNHKSGSDAWNLTDPVFGGVRSCSSSTQGFGCVPCTYRDESREPKYGVPLLNVGIAAEVSPFVWRAAMSATSEKRTSNANMPSPQLRWRSTIRLQELRAI